MKVNIVLGNRSSVSSIHEIAWPDGVRIPVKGEILLMPAPSGELLVDGPVDYVTWEWEHGEPQAYLHVKGIT